MIRPLFVYGNWAAYDELSDGVPLTEELAMRQFGELLRLRSQGVRFDAYLMDAFWFARDGGYRTWRKRHWPNGPDAWLKACADHGVLPGMWFTANTLFEMELPEDWADSIDSKYWGLCLFEGGFLSDFLDVLAYWYGRGVRVFKFDFADLNAMPFAREGKLEVSEARRKNVLALRSGLAEFREGCPEAILLGYNGFEDQDCMDRTDRPAGSYIDPEWLRSFDTMYCGDPRPADLPCGSFWRSVDVYSDCMVRLFESSGYPLHLIDNCGFMAGDTGTCYWRGKQGWQEMLLLSLARGGQVHVAYGDLGLFSDEEAQWWAAAQALYAPAMRQDGTHSFGGWPGDGVPYGWVSRGDGGEILTLVNPSLFTQPVDLPGSAMGAWRVIYSSSGVTKGGDLIELLAGEVVVLASGDRIQALGSELCDLVGEYQSFAAIEGENRARLFVPPGAEGLVRVVIRQFADNGDVLRTWPGDKDRTPFEVVTEYGERREILPRMFPRKIWSGLSWSLYDLEAEGLTAIEVASTETRGVRVVVELLRSV